MQKFICKSASAALRLGLGAAALAGAAAWGAAETGHELLAVDMTVHVDAHEMAHHAVVEPGRAVTMTNRPRDEKQPALRVNYTVRSAPPVNGQATAQVQGQVLMQKEADWAVVNGFEMQVKVGQPATFEARGQDHATRIELKVDPAPARPPA